MKFDFVYFYSTNHLNLLNKAIERSLTQKTYNKSWKKKFEVHLQKNNGSLVSMSEVLILNLESHTPFKYEQI
jgi:hypothetical protein